MTITNIREEIIDLAKRMELGVTDNELSLFFNKHREWFMTESKEPPAIPFWWDTPGTVRFVSCSCGSPTREDSCAEDGKGFYSQFFINTDGEVFRQKKTKTI